MSRGRVSWASSWMWGAWSKARQSECNSLLTGAREMRQINQDTCTVGAWSPLKHVSTWKLPKPAYEHILCYSVLLLLKLTSHVYTVFDINQLSSLLMVYWSADAAHVPPCQDCSAHVWSWRCGCWWDETRSKSGTKCSAVWFMNNTRDGTLMWTSQKDIYRPPAVCSNAPSSAGITKCVTFTTSLLASSWKSHRFF